MKVRKQDLPTYIKVLKEAKKHLARSMEEYMDEDKQLYICYAIGGTSASPQEKHATRDLVLGLLGYTNSVDSYLRVMEYNLGSFDELQVIRHKWVDDLIAWCEENK